MAQNKTLLGSILKGGLTWFSRRRLPQMEGVIQLKGLEADVEIRRDRWGVAHIYAANTADLFFAQGFVQAQDRMFQLELNRRTAQGTLSEVFGAIALDTDRATRTFGFNRLGRIDWQNAGEEFRTVLLAYTEGVNAFLRLPNRKLPVEFTLLNFQPEPWKPEDSTAFARVMMWQLSHAWLSEIVRAQMIEKVGEENAAMLEIQYPVNNPLVLPKGIEFNQLDPNSILHKSNGSFLKASMGSNSWAVSGSKTESGQAYLCNDMHLALGLPGIWHEIHLEGGDIQVSGVSLAGSPGVLVGHNAHIAWGITLAFTDCEDLYVEKFNPQDFARYRTAGGWQYAEVIPEPIAVKGKREPFIEQVLVTHHGPVVGGVVDYAESTNAGGEIHKIALKSMALQPSPSLQAWLQLDRAKNWNEFVAAMRLIEAPQLNISYGDVEGNIGYWVTGKTPIRAKGDGSIPAPGWRGEYEWVGEIPFEEMPHAFNPTSGYLIHTNNRVAPDDYPHWLGNAWMNGYRARRIEEVFKGKEKLSPEDYRKLHLDFTCLPGPELVARLQQVPEDDPDVRRALGMLRTWNGELTPDSLGGSIYEVLRGTLLRNLVEPALGEALTNQWMGQAFNPVLMTAHEFYGNDTVALLRMLDDPECWWVQQAGGLEKLLTNSLKQTVSWLRQTLGDAEDSWQWGRLHRATFPHPLGLQKPLDQVFNRGPFPIGGDTDTPCQTAIKAEAPYDNNAWAPTFRQIVNLGDLTQSVVIAPPGVSGNLGSSHYDDLIQPWLAGEYHPMLWSRQQVEQETESKLVLQARFGK